MILRETFVKGRTKKDKDHWEDLAVTMEFKKSGEEPSCIDVGPVNYPLIMIWFCIEYEKASLQVMTYDPWRRFTFGLTIENTDVRMWFCSRAMLAVSDKFDLNAVRTMIYGILLSTEIGPIASCDTDSRVLVVHLRIQNRTRLGWDHGAQDCR